MERSAKAERSDKPVRANELTAPFHPSPNPLSRSRSMLDPALVPIRFHSHVLRSGRVSLPGHVYLVTTTTASRLPLFRDHDKARVVARICHAANTWPRSACLAWVLMPDHWHGLIELGDEPLSRAMSRFKGIAARELGTPGLWQKGFHDRALRAGDDIKRAARYVVANPVRAGLAGAVLEYPYWDAVWL
jgi:putative transposase